MSEVFSSDAAIQIVVIRRPGWIQNNDFPSSQEPLMSMVYQPSWVRSWRRRSS